MSGTSRITYFGYENCILLENDYARTVVTGSAGRILEYSRKGPNAIYLDPAQKGIAFEEEPIFGPTGGRLDIGPEMTIPAHPNLWIGTWEAENHRSALSAANQQKRRAYRRPTHSRYCLGRILDSFERYSNH